jgi:hypothetical protein
MHRNLGNQIPKDVLLIHENDFWDAIEDADVIKDENNPAKFALEIARCNIPQVKHDVARVLARTFKNMEDFLSYADNRINECGLDQLRMNKISEWLANHRKGYREIKGG